MLKRDKIIVENTLMSTVDDFRVFVCENKSEIEVEILVQIGNN